ncbi:hypothetical protein VKT23_011476 [Stygiomarasmius scandens]|uniref:F-box domain-containing protein n=1 Tax=Marasmiellus scandens TaxID=2682957 RepID=A0ABR1J8B6_9AGAR
MEDEPNESYRPRPKPEMRLYEEDEYELWILCREKANGPAPVTIEVDESKSVWQDPDAYRFYLVSRFFHTLEGFYKGYLDLTGRHQERCIALLSRHSMFMKDMVRVREIAREVRYEDEDWDGTMKTFVTYEITDQGIWNNFRLKWKIPRSISFGWLEDSISQLYDTIRHSGGQPKIQCLCLSKLPPEIIDYIFSFASLDDARLLAATSKQMKAIARPYVFHRRTLCFRLNGGDLAKTISMDETQKEIYLAQLAVEMRQKLCLSIEFIRKKKSAMEKSAKILIISIIP